MIKCSHEKIVYEVASSGGGSYHTICKMTGKRCIKFWVECRHAVYSDKNAKGNKYYPKAKTKPTN